MKKCLVVGGAGFIGASLAAALVAAGDRQVIVTGRSAVPRHTLPTAVRYVCVAPDNMDHYRALMADTDEVVDFAFATVPKTSFDDPVQDVLGNLPFNVALIKLASELKLEKFVFVSSGGTVYGHPEYLPINEAHPTNPVSPYGITKLAVEKYGLMYWRLKGLPFVALRPGNPYGPGQLGGTGQGFVATAMRQLLERRPVTIFGERGTVRDYIFIDDLARGIKAALDCAPSGTTLNIGSGLGLDNRQVFDTLADLARRDGLAPELRIEPARPFDVSANVLDSSRLALLGRWAPKTSFAEGTAQAWPWMKELLA